MVEVLLILLAPVILMPQIAAGYLARQTGRRFWVWFAISFLLPLVSLIILLMIEDKSKSRLK